MYPFERFTEGAKKTLTQAQEEAERSHHSYIGTEHLLLAILRNEGSVGQAALQALGVHITVVRATIETVLGRNERVTVQQIGPTSRVKKVIELSFEEARRTGSQYVGTEHLLLGLLLEGEGIAAHVLSDVGITVERARTEIERQLSHRDAPETISTPVRPPAASGSDLEALEELLAKGPIAQMLRAGGLDVDALAEKLRHAPEVVRNLRRHVTGLSHELEAAVWDADYERAARIQKARGEIAARLRQAEKDWLDALFG